MGVRANKKLVLPHTVCLASLLFAFEVLLFNEVIIQSQKLTSLYLQPYAPGSCTPSRKGHAQHYFLPQKARSPGLGAAIAAVPP